MYTLLLYIYIYIYIYIYMGVDNGNESDSMKKIEKLRKPKLINFFINESRQ